VQKACSFFWMTCPVEGVFRKVYDERAAIGIAGLHLDQSGTRRLGSVQNRKIRESPFMRYADESVRVL
jgi:hypothetical protein